MAEDLVVPMLKAIQETQHRMLRSLDGLRDRVASLEDHVAGIHVDVAIIHKRLDGMDQRIERIERRLDLITPPVDDGPETTGKHKNA